jgi:hypothetical protein
VRLAATNKSLARITRPRSDLSRTKGAGGWDRKQRRPANLFGWEKRAMKMIKRGDRVKLTSRAAAAFNNNMRPGQLDWTDRCGVVERVTANKANVIVRWDGRRSPDDLPIRSVEPEPAKLGPGAS